MISIETLRISKAKLNSLLIFGILPFLIYSGAAIATYLILLAYLIAEMRARNGLLLMLIVALCGISVSLGPYFFQDLSMELLTAVNATFAFFLLLLSPWLKMNIRIEENKFTDLFIIAFLVASLALQIPGVKSEAVLQLGSFTFALYFAMSQNLFRKSCLAFVTVAGGGRSILAGAVYGFAMNRSHKLHRLHKLLSLSLIVLISILAVHGFLFVYFEEYLLALRDRGEYLKGRTGFWLSLLQIKSTLFGNGAGTAFHNIISLMDYKQLPHNDYLRIHVDYGVVMFILLLFSLWLNSLRGAHQLFATSVLAAFLLTGNPLSFPTVIVSYLLVLNSRPIGAMRTSG